MRSLRVGFDARFVDDRYHGIGRFAYQLLEAISRELPSDRFVVFHNPRRPGTRLDPRVLFGRPNVESRPLLTDIYAPEEQATLAWAIARARLDVFYTPYFAAPLLSPVPVITTVHDLIFDHEPRYQSGKWVRFYYRPMMHLAHRRSARVVCVSSATAADLHQIYRVPDDKIAVVAEAAGPQFRPVTDHTRLDDVRRRYDLPETYVLATGVRRPHKNLATLVEAMALARDRIPHTLVLVGEAHSRYEDDVPAAIVRLGMGDRVRELGWTPDEDLSALYTLADVYAIPSLIEGFGLPPLEAMSCGTPVVTSDRSSLPEVVGDAGLLADPRDPRALAEAIVRVATDRELHGRLREKGLARAAEFSWERAAREIRQVISASMHAPRGEQDG